MAAGFSATESFAAGRDIHECAGPVDRAFIMPKANENTNIPEFKTKPYYYCHTLVILDEGRWFDDKVVGIPSQNVIGVMMKRCDDAEGCGATGRVKTPYADDR